MSKMTVSKEAAAIKSAQQDVAPLVKPKANWEKPKLEDVSEQVMAQPYIRFT